MQICDEGGVPVLAEVLENSHDDKELIACCNALWLLCFCNKGSLLVHENEDLKESLSNLKVSINQECYKILHYARIMYSYHALFLMP